MNILFAKSVKNEIMRGNSRQKALIMREIISELERLNSGKSFESNNIRKFILDGGSEIYVLGIKNSRVFFTQKGENLEIIGVVDRFADGLWGESLDSYYASKARSLDI